MPVMDPTELLRRTRQVLSAFSVVGAVYLTFLVPLSRWSMALPVVAIVLTLWLHNWEREASAAVVVGEAAGLAILGILAGSPHTMVLLVYTRAGIHGLTTTPRRAGVAAVVGMVTFFAVSFVHATNAPWDIQRFIESTTIIPMAAGIMMLLRLTAHAFESAAERVKEGEVASVELAAAKERARAARRFETLIAHAADVIVLVEDDGTISYVSSSISRLGHSPESLVGHPLAALVGPQERGPIIPDEGDWEAQLTVTADDGRPRRCEVIGRDLRAAPEVGARMITLRDITERRAMEDELRRLSVSDSLTGLANRTLLLDRIDHAFQRRSQTGMGIAIVMVDVVGFKEINERLGHARSDELLRLIGDRLQGFVRPGDTVARVASDTFAILAEHTQGSEDHFEAAGFIQAMLSFPYVVEGHSVHLEFSIGVALAGEAVVEPEMFLEHASAALRRSKDEGGAVAAYDPASMSGSALQSLRDCLATVVEREELVVHYQPLIRLTDGVPYGVEALVRWDHPTRGRIPPGDFIPIAEETGDIVAIGRWVLEQACRWATTEAPPDLIVSVNMSPRQFSDPRVVEMVGEVLEDTGLDPHRLTLEVTENTLMARADEGAETMERLKALGVALAVDDFGTGYSSLGYLRRFPFDVVKVDRTFVADLAKDERSASVLRAIVRLSRDLDREVIAEGVERPEQVDELIRLGCRLGQGYLYAPPLSAEELAQWLEPYDDHDEALSGPTGVVGA